MTTDQIHKNLYQHLNQMTPIPESEWEKFKNDLQIKTIKKNEYIFHQGDKTAIVGFFLSGFGYSYYANSEGKKMVKNFYWKGRIISPWVSFLQKEPATFSVLALEDSLIAYLPTDTMLSYENSHHCWSLLIKKGLEVALLDREIREYNSLMLNTREQYHQFNQRFHEISDKLPQQLVALYLGINPVSLSRLKKNL